MSVSPTPAFSDRPAPLAPAGKAEFGPRASDRVKGKDAPRGTEFGQLLGRQLTARKAHAELAGPPNEAARVALKAQKPQAREPQTQELQTQEVQAQDPQDQKLQAQEPHTTELHTGGPQTQALQAHALRPEALGPKRAPGRQDTASIGGPHRAHEPGHEPKQEPIQKPHALVDRLDIVPSFAAREDAGTPSLPQMSVAADLRGSASHIPAVLGAHALPPMPRLAPPVPPVLHAAPEAVWTEKNSTTREPGFTLTATPPQQRSARANQVEVRLRDTPEGHGQAPSARRSGPEIPFSNAVTAPIAATFAPARLIEHIRHTFEQPRPMVPAQDKGVAGDMRFPLSLAQRLISSASGQAPVTLPSNEGEPSARVLPGAGAPALAVLGSEQAVAAPMGAPALAPSMSAPAIMPAAGMSSSVLSPGWTDALNQQVSFMATKAALQGPQSVELRLDPPELGPLRISVRVDQGVASAAFFSAHAPVRALIEQSLVHLQQSLSQAGLSLGQADVNDEPGARNLGHEQTSQGRHEHERKRMTEGAAAAREVNDALDAGPVLAARAHEGLVSAVA